MSSTQTVSYDYDLQDASGATCTAHAWAKVPAPLAADEKARVKDRIKALLKARNAVLVLNNQYFYGCSHAPFPLT